MKKIVLIITAAFVAALSMTSCVELTESSSVTAIREAKAEQLRAMADAARISAKADSIIAAAQAEYLKAQAAYENARAEAEAWELERLKENYERNLEAIMQEAENRLIEAQNEAERLRREARNASDENLRNLYYTYYDELTKLNDLKAELNRQELLRLQYEAELISAQEVKNAELAILQANLDNLQAQMDAYNAYTGLDKADLDAEVLRLFTLKENAWSDRLAKMQMASEAEVALDGMLEETYDISNIGPNTIREIVVFDSLSYGYGLTLYFGEITFTDERFQYEAYPPERTVRTWSFRESEITAKRAELMQRVEYITNGIGKPSTETEPATGLYINLEAAEAALKAAEAADPQDPVLIEQCKADLLKAQEDLARANENLESYKESLKDFERLIKEVTGENLDKYMANLLALKDHELMKAYFNAEYDAMLADSKYWEIDAQYSAADDLANNYGIIDVQAQIRNIESQMATVKEQIARWTVINEEMMLKQVEDQIATLNAQIGIQQTVVDLALKAIEDYLQEQK